MKYSGGDYGSIFIFKTGNTEKNNKLKAIMFVIGTLIVIQKEKANSFKLKFKFIN